jgi:peptide/nickel transport system ATP-binding protein
MSYPNKPGAPSADADDPILQINGLKLWYKIYKGYSKVLDGVDLRVCRGQKVGIVGEAGCGKTTTVKAIPSILPKRQHVIPEGEILYKGKDIRKMNDRELGEIRSGEISMIYQEPSAALNPVFTVGQQMTDVVKYAAQGRDKSKKARREIVLQAIRDVLIPDPERIFDFYPHQLSGGMKQRVCIAMAVMTQRDLMIADEPGTALDVTIQSQIHKMLNRLVEERNMSLIMITHSLGVARELTDVINIMYAGTVVETAPSEELFRHALHPYTAGLMAAVPRLLGGGMQAGIYGSIPNYLSPPPGCRFAPRCKAASRRCAEEKPLPVDVGARHKVACFNFG